VNAAITKEEVLLLPTVDFNKQIIVADTPKTAERAVKYLSHFLRLGFDTETRPAFQKGRAYGTSLIQIASDEVCVLFRVNKIGFPPALERLLSDTNILKIGLSLRDDYQMLNRRRPNLLQKDDEGALLGFVDLQHIVNNFGINELSLQKIYALLFHERISKGQRTSNWEAAELTYAQKKYAALDAWACLKIYEKLCP
jgi:ribonuclease D